MLAQALELLDVPTPGYDSFQLDAFADGQLTGSSAKGGKFAAVGELESGRWGDVVPQVCTGKHFRPLNMRMRACNLTDYFVRMLLQLPGVAGFERERRRHRQAQQYGHKHKQRCGCSTSKQLQLPVPCTACCILSIDQGRRMRILAYRLWQRR